MNDIPVWRRIGYALITPFFIFFWMILNPKKVWEQAKKDWNSSGCNNNCNQGRTCNCRKQSQNE